VSSFFVARVPSCSVTGTLDDYKCRRYAISYDNNIIRILPRSCSAIGYTAAIRIVIGAPAGVRVAGRYAACSWDLHVSRSRPMKANLPGRKVVAYLYTCYLWKFACLRAPLYDTPPATAGHPRSRGCEVSPLHDRAIALSPSPSPHDPYLYT